jgi:Tol biopolymer transport system component
VPQVAPALQSRWPLVLAATVLVLVAGAAIAWFVTRHPQPQKQPAERQLTANPPEDYVTAAAISPDGKQIANRDQTRLYIRSIDSGETHAVSLPEGFQKHQYSWGLQWFPDGGKLHAGVSRTDGADLWVINLLGEATPRLLIGDAAESAISPTDG